MTTRLDDLRPLLEQAFRQRREEIVACEQVMEISRGGTMSKNPRLLVLSGPFAAAVTASPLAGASLSIVREEGARAVKLRQVFGIARLVDVTHDSSFGATFNFGSSGMISVSFESHIQCVMFVAAVRKLQRAVAPAAVHAVPTLLSDGIGAAADADAAARAKGLRHARQRALSADDGRLLLRFLSARSFDDIRAAESSLAARQKRAELLSANLLVSSADAWSDVRADVTSLVAEVDELEARIAPFSRHVLARRAQLEHLERSGNTLRRKQCNLERLREGLRACSARLSLPAGAAELLREVRDASGAALAGLLASGTSSARLLAETMRHMEALLRDEQLTREYPIAAVAERRAFFIAQRRMAAARAREFALHAIAQREAQYIADRTRLSGRDRIVWRPHVELCADLRGVSDLLTALSHVDAAGAFAVLRRYRVAMQRVYAAEMHHFFKALRAQVRRFGARGPFLIGVRDTPDDALAGRMETTAAGESPRGFGASGSSAPPSPSRCPSVSFGLTPRGVYSAGTGGTGGTSGIGCGASIASTRRGARHMLEIDLPAPCEEGQRLYNPSAAGAVPAAAKSVASVVSAVSGVGAGGQLRPDLGFAMVLEAVAAAVLREEEMLKQCFGLAATNSRGHPYENEKHAKDGEGGEEEEEAEKAEEGKGEETKEKEKEFTPLPGGELSPAELLEESLLELFGGDRLVGFENIRDPLHSGNGNANKDPSLSAKRRASGDLTSEWLQECYLARQLVAFAEYCRDRCDRLYAIPMVVMIRAYRREGTRTAASPFLMRILSVLERTVADTVARSAAEQTASIVACRKRYMLHPSGLLCCFAKLPAFILRMEAMHNAMPFTVCDRSEYTSIAQTLVDQSFDALNFITNLSSGGATSSGVRADSAKLGHSTSDRQHLTLAAGLRKNANRLLDGAGDHSGKRGFIQQYRHHAFFCASYASLREGGGSCYARDLLSDRNEASRALRDQYEELYLTRVVLVRDFPVFGCFALTAEDLAQVHTREELRHHNALSLDKVEHMLRGVAKEMRAGIASASARMKKHFLRDVAGRREEESFHCTLLQRTWQHFVVLFLQKVDFVMGMLRWPMYAGLEMPITRSEVVALLEAA